MNARKFKAVVHLGTRQTPDMPDHAWISLINEALRSFSFGIQLELQSKEWEPPGGLVRPPLNPFKRNRRRR